MYKYQMSYKDEYELSDWVSFMDSLCVLQWSLLVLFFVIETR